MSEYGHGSTESGHSAIWAPIYKKNNKIKYKNGIEIYLVIIIIIILFSVGA